PVARVPVPPAAIHEDDPIVMASPPITIVPLPLVITEDRIPLAAERVTVPVIGNFYVASTIIGGVSCAVHRDVSIPIDRYVIATAKLIRVAITINVGISCPIHRCVSFTIRVDIPCPVHRDIPVAIRRYVSVAIDRGISVARCSC